MKLSVWQPHWTESSPHTFTDRAAASLQRRDPAADVVVFVGAVVLLWVVVRVGRGTTVP